MNRLYVTALLAVAVFCGCVESATFVVDAARADAPAADVQAGDDAPTVDDTASDDVAPVADVASVERDPGRACSNTSDCPGSGARCIAPDLGYVGGYCVYDCEHAEPCGAHGTCVLAVQRVCYRACRTALDCRDGYTCLRDPTGNLTCQPRCDRTSGYCGPDVCLSATSSCNYGCTSSTQCSANSLCTRGACSCTAATNCGTAFVCDLVSGQCVLR